MAFAFPAKGRGDGQLSSTIILATWIGRGVVLSGYPFFPASAMPMPVAWRTPAARVDGFRTLIRGWARDREDVARSLRGWHWVANWYQRVAPEMTNRFTWPAAGRLRRLGLARGVCDFCKTATTKFARFSLPGCSTLYLRDLFVHNGPGAEIFRNDGLGYSRCVPL